jgi:hypothetical protein
VPVHARLHGVPRQKSINVCPWSVLSGQHPEFFPIIRRDWSRTNNQLFLHSIHWAMQKRPCCIWWGWSLAVTWPESVVKQFLCKKQRFELVLRRCLAAANSTFCVCTSYRQFPSFVHRLDAKAHAFKDGILVPSFLYRVVYEYKSIESLLC